MAPAPEQKADRILPIVPNEICLRIFEHIAPPTGHLTPEQRRTYTHLSRVCRFIANFYFPRVFEFVEFEFVEFKFVEFSGAVFRHCMPTQHEMDVVYETSCEFTLCTQIAARQPLAPTPAKTVKTCHFTNWELYHTGPCMKAVRLLANKYLAEEHSRIRIFLLLRGCNTLECDCNSTIA